MMSEGSGGDDSTSSSATPTVEMIEEEEPVNPDLIETVAFCKNIINTEVLTEALKGFQGNIFRALLMATMIIFFCDIIIFCCLPRSSHQLFRIRWM